MHTCRLQYVSIKSVENYALRQILLNFAKSSFEDCRTVDGVVHETMQLAAEAHGIVLHNNGQEGVIRFLIDADAKKRDWDVALSKDNNAEALKLLLKPVLRVDMNGPMKLFNVWMIFLLEGTPASPLAAQLLQTYKYFFLCGFEKEETFWTVLQTRLHRDMRSAVDYGIEIPPQYMVNDQTLNAVNYRSSALSHEERVIDLDRRIQTLTEAQRLIFEEVMSNVWPASCRRRIQNERLPYIVVHCKHKGV